MSELDRDEPEVWGYVYDHKGNCIGTAGPPVFTGPPEPVIVNPFKAWLDNLIAEGIDDAEKHANQEDE